jgi:hypothetical protein
MSGTRQAAHLRLMLASRCKIALPGRPPERRGVGHHDRWQRRAAPTASPSRLAVGGYLARRGHVADGVVGPAASCRDSGGTPRRWLPLGQQGGEDESHEAGGVSARYCHSRRDPRGGRPGSATRGARRDQPVCGHSRGLVIREGSPAIRCPSRQPGASLIGDLGEVEHSGAGLVGGAGVLKGPSSVWTRSWWSMKSNSMVNGVGLAHGSGGDAPAGEVERDVPPLVQVRSS